MASRTLARVSIITELTPTPNESSINIAIVEDMPCAMTDSTAKVGDLVFYVAVDTFIPEDAPRGSFFFDTKVNGFHNHKEVLRYLPSGTIGSDGLSIKRSPKAGIRVKPIIVSGALSAGLAITMSEQVKTELQEIARSMSHPDMLSQQAVAMIAKHFHLEEYQQHVAFNVVWDRPDFIPDPAVKDIEEMRHVLQPQYKQEKYQVTTTPAADSKASTVYFLREGTDMANCLSHRQETGSTTEGIGRVGVCGTKLDLFKQVGNRTWAAIADTQLIEKLAALGKNIAIQWLETGRPGLLTPTVWVIGIWDLDSQTRWSVEETKKQVSKWGLCVLPIAGTVTLQEIAFNHALAKYQKKAAPLLLRSVDGKHIFSQKKRINLQ